MDEIYSPARGRASARPIAFWIYNATTLFIIIHFIGIPFDYYRGHHSAGEEFSDNKVGDGIQGAMFYFLFVCYVLFKIEKRRQNDFKLVQKINRARYFVFVFGMFIVTVAHLYAAQILSQIPEDAAWHNRQAIGAFLLGWIYMMSEYFNYMSCLINSLQNKK